jgi:hypothetical protein
MAFCGDYALHDSDGWTGSFAANAESALAAVRITDSQNRVAIGGGAVIDQVVEDPY